MDKTIKGWIEEMKNWKKRKETKRLNERRKKDSKGLMLGKFVLLYDQGQKKKKGK